MGALEARARILTVGLESASPEELGKECHSARSRLHFGGQRDASKNGARDQLRMSSVKMRHRLGFLIALTAAALLVIGGAVGLPRDVEPAPFGARAPYPWPL